MVEETIGDIVTAYAIDKVPGHQWDWQGIAETLHRTFAIELDLPDQTVARLTQGLPAVLRDALIDPLCAALDMPG